MSHFLTNIKKQAWKVVLGLLIGLIAGFFWYTSDYYRADDEAMNILNNANDVTEFDAYVELKANSDIGLIFYPGAKVESYAYLVLLNALKEEGINVFLIKMPFNLAVLNINAADSIIKTYPTIKEWYIAGHSLGGAMASQYLDKNSDLFEGLIQLAAYPLNDSEANTLILYGSNDYILDLSNLEGFDAINIVGGNHAYFGHYGEQEGDGVALITREDQQQKTIEAILNFIQ
jgi:dienelactone hydrolase